MNIENRLKELNQYTVVVYNILNHQKIDPKTLIVLVYHPRYYPALESIMNDEAGEMLKLQQCVYDQIIPWITEKLPSGLILEYVTDQYYPFLFVTEADGNRNQLGRINLAERTFEIFRMEGAHKLDQEVEKKQEEINRIESDIQKALNAGDYAAQETVGKAALVYLGRKHFVKKAIRTSDEMMAGLNQAKKELADLEQQRNQAGMFENVQRQKAIEISGILEECGFRAHFVDSEKDENIED